MYTAAEDRLSATVLERLIIETNGALEICVSIPPKGSGELKRKLQSLIKLAPNVPVIMLTDLDLKACAPSLAAEWFGNTKKPKPLLFRVAVREVEAWLLADRTNFSEFAKVPLTKIPKSPEALDDPKQTLLNLIARYSPSTLKSDVISNRGHDPKQGLAYNERLSQFVLHDWDPVQASSQADSLARTRKRISELASDRSQMHV